MLAVPMKPQDPIILLTRPKSAAKDFTNQLREAGITVDVLVSPVQGIRRVKFEEPTILTGAIFTSRNGVDAVIGRNVPCWCVGDATTEAARAKGWQAVSAQGDADALFRRIMADQPKGPLVHFRGLFARGNLAERLNEEGIEAIEVIVYHQVSNPLSDAAQAALARRNPVIVPLFSPRSAAQLVQQGPFLAGLWVIAISDAVVGEAVALSPTKVEISPTPDAKGMVAAIKRVINAGYGIEGQGKSP